jgi:glycine/D-amino acid oxidase-like deaminating enzyme
MPFSFWEREALKEIDVLIVGGGLVGLSTAASLLERNPKLKVVVAERSTFPLGASTKNAGFACFGSVTELLSDSKTMSQTELVDLVAYRYAGLQKLRSRLGDSAIDYESCRGYELITGKEYRALERVEEVNEWLTPIFKEPVFSQAPEKLNSFGWKGSAVKALIQNSFEGALNPVKTLQALRQYGVSRGLIYLTAAASGYEEEASGCMVRLQLNQGEEISVACGKLVICTNAFASELLKTDSPTPGRGQVLITEPLEKLPLNGVFHYDEGYYYFRNVGSRLLLGGGRNLDFEGEKTTSFDGSEQIRNSLVKLLHEVILPGTKVEIDMHWSGILAFGENRIPKVRTHGNHCLSAVGLGGMGVAVASAIGDEVAGRIA